MENDKRPDVVSDELRAIFWGCAYLVALRASLTLEQVTTVADASLDAFDQRWG